MDFMEGLMQPIIREKILSGFEAPLPTLTLRDARVPNISGKAMVVIGMRRAPLVADSGFSYAISRSSRFN